MKIGLALGCGSARGWAHIGVIEKLNELGINIDVVAGCSAGSYVGAAFANNQLAQLKEWVVNFSEWQVAGLLGVGINRGGVFSGDKVFKQLQSQFKVESFEQLGKTFGAVATDLYSGKEIWLTQGNVIESIQASCATPGLFPAVWYEQESRWLVDGGVVNPVPVSLCRHLGADFVIAVNLNADYRPGFRDQNTAAHQQNQEKTNDLIAKSKNLLGQWIRSGNGQTTKPANPSILGSFSAALSIMQDRVTRSKLVGEPPELLIEPQLAEFGMMEYHRGNELIAEGRASVERLEQHICYQMSRIGTPDTYKPALQSSEGD